MSRAKVPRVLLLVCDSWGVGDAPDAAAFGDEGSDTLRNTARAVGGLRIPHLEDLGIGLLTEIDGVEGRAGPGTAHGRATERSAGKDTTTGHWEMMGIRLDDPFPLYPDGFPPEIVEAFEQEIGRSILGNVAASGTEIIAELGQEHLRTGRPIVYTSGDSVFQVAAHLDVVDLETLYGWCRIARTLLDGPHRVGRVIARPFDGRPAAFVRRSERRDFSVPPPGATVLDVLVEAGVTVSGVGKIGDIFSGNGVPESTYSDSNDHGIEITIDRLGHPGPSLVFTNLVDFDSKYGHRNDVAGYAAAIKALDRRIPELIAALDGGVMFITGDHGCDPTTPSTDHSRERVPLLAAGLTGGPYAIGTRDGFGDLGATIADLFGVTITGLYGSSFAPSIGLGGMSLDDPRRVVAAKRDGQVVAPDDVEAFVRAYVTGEVSDALAAAFLMACLLNGLDDDETHALTSAMIALGRTLSFGSLERPTVDKHSTGGVADGVTLVFAPLAAALGLAVVKLSGRGLGHTGGTLDKLESIPGLRTDLSPEAIERQVAEVGCAVAAQSADLVPADGALYALRDATATVPSIPLIAASVMSKKLAVDTDLILLDVKVGSGAFMKGAEDAGALATACRRLADAAGRGCRVAVTDMSQPLGDAIGNALDVAEAVGILQGTARGRLRDLAVWFAGRALEALRGAGFDAACRAAERVLDDGTALDRFRQMVVAQGGDPSVADDPSSVLPSAPMVVPLVADRSGWLAATRAEAIGLAAGALGAGRVRKGDPIDPSVGIVLHPKIGDVLEAGEEIGLVHARDEASAELATAEVLAALDISAEEVAAPSLVIDWMG